MVISYQWWLQNCPKFSCAQRIAIKKRILKFQETVVLRLAEERKKTRNLVVPSSALYLILWWIYSILGTKETLFTCIVNQGLGESRLPWSLVWMDLYWSECLGQSGIWTSLNGGIWSQLYSSKTVFTYPLPWLTIKIISQCVAVKAAAPSPLDLSMLTSMGTASSPCVTQPVTNHVSTHSSLLTACFTEKFIYWRHLLTWKV